MATHEDAIVSAQGAGRPLKVGILCKKSFMTKFDALMIILVNYEDQQGSTLTMVGMRDE